MPYRESYWMQAEWGSRVETPAAIAARFLRTVDGLGALDPLLETWDWGDYQEVGETEGAGGSYPLAAVRPRMAEAVARNMGNGGEDGPDPDPYYGYCLMAQTDATAPGSLVSLSGSVGARPGQREWDVVPFTNRMAFEVGPEPDPTLLRYALWRAALLLLAETWEASWVEAAPHDMSEHWGTTRAFRAAWMSYLSPRLAPLVVPPAGVVVERRPNGGLFMAATDTMFTTADPRHLAAARAIEAALAPLNRLPYPIDAPYR